jgi:hypothetical protein
MNDLNLPLPQKFTAQSLNFPAGILPFQSILRPKLGLFKSKHLGQLFSKNKAQDNINYTG